jgi:hypothetical protein
VEKEAFAMKASINKATIILPFNHARDAAGFFFGKSPKSRMDFSLLKCISTYPVAGIILLFVLIFWEKLYNIMHRILKIFGGYYD